MYLVFYSIIDRPKNGWFNQHDQPCQGCHLGGCHLLFQKRGRFPHRW